MSESLNINTASAGLHAVGDSQPNVLHQKPTFDEHHIQTMMQNSDKLLSGVEQLSKDVSNREAQQDDTPSKAPGQQDRVAEEEHQIEGEQQHDQSKNTSRRNRKHNSSQQKNQKKNSTSKARATFNKTDVDTKGKKVKETHSDNHDATSSSKSSHDGADDQKKVGLFPKTTPQVPKEVVNEKAATEEEEEESAATAKVAPRADVPANEGAFEDDDDSGEVDAGAPSLVNVPGAGVEEAPDDEDSLGETMDSIASKKKFDELPRLRVPDEKKVSDDEGSSNDPSEEDDDSDEVVDAGAPSLTNVPDAGEEEAQNDEDSSGETMDSIASKKKFNEWLGLRVLDEEKVSDDEGSSNNLSKEDDDETFDDDFVYDDEGVDTTTHEVPTNNEAPAKAPVLKRVSSKDAAQMLKDIFKNY